MPGYVNGIPHATSTDRIDLWPTTSRDLAQWVDDNVPRNDDPRLTNARPPTTHTHPISGVTGLQAALNGKTDTTDPRLSDARTPTAHSHPISGVTGLQAALNGKTDTTDPRLSDARTPTAHSHSISGVTGLQDALDAGAYFRGTLTPPADIYSLQAGAYRVVSTIHAESLGLPVATGTLHVSPSSDVGGSMQYRAVAWADGAWEHQVWQTNSTGEGSWTGWARVDYGALTEQLDTALAGKQDAATALPDRGRARTIAADPDNGFVSVNDITAPGRWQVWTAADATTLGLPNNVAGSLDIYTFGNVIEQVYRQHYSGGIIEIGRRKAGTTWGAWRTMTVDDTSVSALIAPGTATEAAIKDLIPDPDQGEEKTAAVALSSGDGGTKAVITDQSFRYPFKVGASVKRWRVHIQNVATRYGSRLTGALAFKGLGFSRDAGETVGPDMEGRLSGSTWEQIDGPFDTNAFGWEYVSPWVETPLEAGARYLLSGGFTGAAGQEVYTGVGGAWTTPDSDDWNVSSPGAGMSLTQAGPLFVWLEVVIDARTPVIGVFGDSLGQGHSARLPVYDGIGNRHGWAHGHIVTLYTNSGSTMGDHVDETHYRWHRYDTANPAKLDGMLFEMGSNDIFGGAGLALLKERYETCQDIITRNFTPRIVGMTVLPRHDPMDPSETTRQAFNEWLLTEKAGDLVAVADAAAPLADPAESRQIDKRWTAAPSDIHLTASGYARFMQGLPPLHT